MGTTTQAEGRPARWIRSVLLPLLVGSGAVAVAAAGAFLTGSGADATGGVNGFVEGLSGRSGSGLESLGLFGFTYAAGMVATVNPCGFAMLPAYLGLYLGATDAASTPSRLRQAVIVGLLVTAGTLLLFGSVGIVLSAGLTAIRSLIPWLGLIIGVALTFAGAWVMMGGKLSIGAFSRAAAHVGDARQTTLRGYFLFGLSYGTASLSCTLPIFIAVVGFGTTTSFLTAFGQFLLYGLGMGSVILVLTLGMAAFKGAMVGGLRKALPYIQPVSAAIMLLAGAYIVFYWLTLGLDLL